MTREEMEDKIGDVIIRLESNYIYDDILTEILDILEDVYYALRDGETKNGNQ